MLRKLAMAFALLLSAASMAVAEDAPRKIDFSTVLVGPEGPYKECKKVEQGKCTEEVELTLQRVCVTAAAKADPTMGVPEQIAHGKLAMKLLENKELVLTADDVAFLKRQVATLGYNTMVVYQVMRLLDPAVDK